MDFVNHPFFGLCASLLAALLLTLAAIWRVLRAAAAVPSASRQGRTARRLAWLYAAGALVWLGYAGYAGYGRFLSTPALAQFVLPDTLISMALFIAAIAWAAAFMVQLVLRLLKTEQQRQG
ncbi:hypothetical protein N0K08_11675 [Acidovorax sp. Be4]|uniref:Uncharacterized protein n=1 Tax=Acidovorax bellezanensis TaxID=2976702 RepID=A0ABT2PQA6_9BURK|nr:hypothetical protein [Acidovorax sp. Be4]MCT9811298.1 hypothetical protein [Acidovorax sp. Be4]